MFRCDWLCSRPSHTSHTVSLFSSSTDGVEYIISCYMPCWWLLHPEGAIHEWKYLRAMHENIQHSKSFPLGLLISKSCFRRYFKNLRLWLCHSTPRPVEYVSKLEQWSRWKLPSLGWIGPVRPCVCGVRKLLRTLLCDLWSGIFVYHTGWSINHIYWEHTWWMGKGGDFLFEGEGTSVEFSWEEWEERKMERVHIRFLTACSSTSVNPCSIFWFTSFRFGSLWFTLVQIPASPSVKYSGAVARRESA